jgi:general secretion pathway protein H
MSLLALMRNAPRTPEAAENGFTLLELLVVMVIALLAAGLMVPRFAALLPGVELKSQAQQLAALLRQTRSSAIAESREITLRLSEVPQGVWISNREDLYPIPSNISIALDGAQSFPMDPGASYIRFFPDGGSTGGALLLNADDGRGFRIRVDWLTGRVSIDE